MSIEKRFAHVHWIEDGITVRRNPGPIDISEPVDMASKASCICVVYTRRMIRGGDAAIAGVVTTSIVVVSIAVVDRIAAVIAIVVTTST